MGHKTNKKRSRRIKRSKFSQRNKRSRRSRKQKFSRRRKRQRGGDLNPEQTDQVIQTIRDLNLNITEEEIQDFMKIIQQTSSLYCNNYKFNEQVFSYTVRFNDLLSRIRNMVRSSQDLQRLGVEVEEIHDDNYFCATSDIESDPEN